MPILCMTLSAERLPRSPPENLAKLLLMRSICSYWNVPRSLTRKTLIIYVSSQYTDTILKAVCVSKGIDYDALGTFDIREYKERQYDLLADAVRSGMDMDYVYRVLNREV